MIWNWSSSGQDQFTFGLTGWTWAMGVAVVATDTGTDFTLTDNRAEYTVGTKRPEFTIKTKRPEFTLVKS